MIVTVTPAPALDWTLRVERFQLGDVNRAEDQGKEVSGKGVNISWALLKAGIQTRAVFPAGGRAAALVREVLAESGMNFTIVETEAEMRTNVTLIVPGFPETKVNTAGAPLSPAEVDEFMAVVKMNCEGADTVMVCGSLPAGMPATLHRDIVEMAKLYNKDTIVDASGEALRIALEAGPGLIKPNTSELAELAEFSVATFGDVERAAHAAREQGARAVLASLGADGIMLVDDHGSLLAHASDISVVNAVGAGDAALAGFVAGGPDREARLRNAVLWASSAVGQETTLFEVQRDLQSRIQVNADFSRERTLREPSNFEREIVS
jgi:1-phosphofructokinase